MVFHGSRLVFHGFSWFQCSFAKFPSSFSFLLKPSDHLLKVDAKAENLANNDMPTAAQFDVKLALDLEIINK